MQHLAHIPNASEDDICIEFAETLEKLVAMGQVVNPASFCFWHNDNGQRAGRDKVARAIAGKRAKRLGVKRGLLDYSFLFRDEEGVPYYAELEAKTRTGELTPEQVERIAFLQKEAVPVAVFRSATEGLKILQKWGVIKAGVAL